jgi:hypothetical protein
LNGQKAYSKISLKEITAPMSQLLNNWADDAMGKTSEEFSRLFNSAGENRAKAALLGQFNGLGYQVLALSGAGVGSGELDALVYTLMNKLHGINAPVSKLFLELTESPGKGEAGTGVGATDTEKTPVVAEESGGIGKVVSDIIEYITDTDPKKKEEIKVLLEKEVGQEVLNKYAVLKKDIGKMSDETLELNSGKRKKFDMMTVDLINMYSKIGFDKATGEDFNLLEQAISISEESAFEHLRLKFGDTPMFEIHKDGEGVRIKRNTPRSTGSFPKMNDVTARAQKISVPEFTKQMNSIFEYYKSVQGYSVEDFAKYMQGHAVGEDLTKTPVEEVNPVVKPVVKGPRAVKTTATDEKGELTQEELEVEPPTALKKLDVKGMRLYQNTHGNSMDALIDLQEDPRFKGDRESQKTLMRLFQQVASED